MTISGNNISLRLVDVSDGAFILSLRLSPRGRYLSPVEDNLQKQEDWIRRYKSREARGAEYYFIITHNAAGDVGTVRIHDINEKSFWWGSWILKEDAPRDAALESACLVYDLGFLMMRRELAHFVVLKSNTKSIRFNQRFGARIGREDDTRVFFEITRDEYLDVRRRLERDNVIRLVLNRLAVEEECDGPSAGSAQAG